jgi:outer membrane lipase/esterase
MHRFLRNAFATALLAAGLTSAQASPSFSNLFIFGDSLADTGNLSLLTGGAVPGNTQPYDNGRFSNGPLWVETLASGMGLGANVAAPSIAGGNNYAIAGARADVVGANGLALGTLVQVATFASLVPPSVLGASYTAADPNALYVLVAGGNDMRDSRNANPGAAGAAQRAADATTAIGNLGLEMQALRGMGAQHVLIANLPDLGATPEAALLGVQADSTDASNQFNARVPFLAAFGASIGLDVTVLDLFGLMQAIINDANTNGAAEYGITNVTSPCAGFSFSSGASCDVSLFSDALHPSARAHELIGIAALHAIGIPEPQTLLLVMLGCAALLARRRRV